MIDVNEMQLAVQEALKKKIRVYPRNSLWASQLAHPCLRSLEYGLTRWQDQMQITPELQAIFDEGREHEELILKRLKESGFQIRQTQRPLFEKVKKNGEEFRYSISGRLDFEMMHETGTEGEWLPVEAKSMEPHAWEGINNAEDMLKHKRYYIRMYPCQLVLYLYLMGREAGVMILKNKVNGQLKFIPIRLDYVIAEGLLRAAETVNEVVALIEKFPEEAEKVLTDRIPYDENICGGCVFRHICLPEGAWKGEEMVIDEETEAELERWRALRVTAKEFKDLDESLKAQFKKRGEGKYLIAASFDVKVSKVPTTAYDIPPDIQAPYARATSYLRVDIKPLPPKV